MMDYFNERIAASYDEACVDMFATDLVDTTVDVLTQLAGRGRALEFGIGTGRIALPLAMRGVSVYGVDLSPAMVARLRAKTGGEAIGVTIGNFATTRVDGTFTLVYLVFNTIMNLTTQAAGVSTARSRSDMCGRRNLTSWRSLLDCDCASAGRAGRENRSRAQATIMSRYGNRRRW